MDVRMPDLDGIAATRQLVATSPDVRVVILTTFEQDDYIFGAIDAGASGFLLKRTRPEELLSAIHAVAAGDSLLSPSVTRIVLDRLARQPVLTPDSTGRLADLTPREREVLELIASGQSNGEIAATLVIEESTRQDPHQANPPQARPARPHPRGHLRLRDRAGSARTTARRVNHSYQSAAIGMPADHDACAAQTACAAR